MTEEANAKKHSDNGRMYFLYTLRNGGWPYAQAPQTVCYVKVVDETCTRRKRQGRVHYCMLQVATHKTKNDITCVCLEFCVCEILISVRKGQQERRKESDSKKHMMIESFDPAWPGIHTSHLR